MEITREISFKNVMFSSGAVHGDDIYFWTWNNRDFMKMDLNTGFMSYISTNNIVTKLDSPMDFVFSEDDNIYAISMNGEKLIIYDIFTQKIICEEIKFKGKRWGNFATCEKIQDILYLFPCDESYILSFNLKTKEQYKIKGIYGESNKCKNQNIIYSQGIRVRDDIFLYSNESSKIIKYNLKEGMWKEYDLGKHIKGCRSLIYYQNQIYLLDDCNNIYVWNFQKEIVYLQWRSPSDLQQQNLFSSLEVVEKFFILLPNQGNDIIVIDSINLDYKKYDSYPDDYEYLSPIEWSKFYRRYETEETIVYSLRSANYVLQISKNSGKIRWIKPILPSMKNTADYLIKNKKQNYFIEGIIDLNTFLSLTQKNDLEKITKFNYGKSIWKNITM